MAKINKIKATKKTKAMPRFEKQGQSKIINSYGAVGTLIQTINNGSILISDFDTWPFYNFLITTYQNENAADYLINNSFIQDNRLVNRLAKELNINTLLGIFRMPENKYIPQNNTVEKPNRVISASFFPCWFYCPTCGNMNYYIRNNANPQFPHCHGLPKEQFSFVLISSSGEIAEIPWMEFLRSNPADINIRFSPNNQIFLITRQVALQNIWKLNQCLQQLMDRLLEKVWGPYHQKYLLMVMIENIQWLLDRVIIYVL